MVLRYTALIGNLILATVLFTQVAETMAHSTASSLWDSKVSSCCRCSVVDATVPAYTSKLKACGSFETTLSASLHINGPYC